MLKDTITCLIFSCDKFSDLWDANLKLFRENWPERDFETFIVTDKPTEYTLCTSVCQNGLCFRYSR